MVIDLILFVVLGIGLGFASMKMTEILIDARIKPDSQVVKVLGTKQLQMVWLIGMATLCALTAWRVDSPFHRVEYMLLFCIVASISGVDISLRLIPNQLLLAILGLKSISTIFLIISDGFSWDKITTPLIGLVVGFVLFVLPTIFNLGGISNGDIKYAAVIGFYFGFTGFLQSMIFMALSELVFLVVLKVTKKGGLKTWVPMGPFLSLGAVVTAFVPLF